ncbi:MAG: hypothetical protein AAB400_02290 [Patescibacteria group bacterium]
MNHELHCPVRRGADRQHLDGFNAGYMDRLRERHVAQEHPVYELGWQQADRYLARLALEQPFKPS